MKIFKSKKAIAFLAIPAFWWAITGLFSVVGIWLFRKPSEGIFGQVPFIGWVVGALILIVIIRSRK